MSCSQATAPINITKAGSTGPCELKCDYTFNYNDSDTTVTNNGTYLSFSYDQANVPPVTFNAERYRVEEVRLYRPSLHTYDGAAADGEIIILHSSNTSKLLVCVPIIGSTAVTKSGTLLGQVMPKVGRYAATAGQTANLNVSDFNLGSLVPNKPFYSYIGTLPYSPCNGTYNYVVFDMLTPATMSPASLIHCVKKELIASRKGGVANLPNITFLRLSKIFAISIVREPGVKSEWNPLLLMVIGFLPGPLLFKLVESI